MSALIRKEDCEGAIQNLLGSSDFVLEGYECYSLADSNFGFMGRHVRIKASVLKGEEIEEIRLFAKLPPSTESHRSFVIQSKLFHRELVAYTSLAPAMGSYLPQGETIPLPRCLFSRDTVIKVGRIPVPGSLEEELIIMEDMTYKGYNVLDKFPPVDLLHCRTVMRSLARLHAPSLLYEESDRSSVSRGIIQFGDPLWKQDMNKGWVTSCSQSVATAAARIWPKRFRGRRGDILKSLDEAWELIYEASQAFPQYKNVMCHGDPWTNNIMFSYEVDEESGMKIPVDAVFVDLQIVQCAPPVTDIMIFLHVSTRRGLRDDHLRELLEYYHASLCEYVPSDVVERVVPLRSLISSYNDFKVVGPVISSHYLPIILEANDDMLSKEKKSTEGLDEAEDILKDRGERIAANCVISSAYGERLRECFQECLEGLGLWD